jgi:hypothetical protein
MMMSLVVAVVRSAVDRDVDRDVCFTHALDGHEYSLLCIDGVRAPKIKRLYMISLTIIFLLSTPLLEIPCD